MRLLDLFSGAGGASRGYQFAGFEISDEVIERFWAKVDRTDGCWNWTAATLSGYGRFCVRKPHIVGAHRFSYALAYGEVPEDLSVLHHCDNRRCVRPDHLFTGTQKDNIADMIGKGRYRGGFKRHPIDQKGSANGYAVLTEQSVAEIRQLLAEGMQGTVIAKRFGISKSTVSAIRVGKRWRPSV